MLELNQEWTADILGSEIPSAGTTGWVRDHWIKNDGGILRDLTVVDPNQAQTRDAFGFKWAQVDTFSTKSPAVVNAQKEWHRTRLAARDLLSWLDPAIDQPTILDAGCGSGFSAAILLADAFDRIRYVGADISDAVDIAAKEIGSLARKSLFVQADMTSLPFQAGAFDCIIAEGTLHHTPSTKRALASLATLLRHGGIIEFYVYAKKGPVREFTDDFIRDELSRMSPEEGWKAMESLTKLGIALGELGVTVDVPEAIPYLGIPAGPVDIQRFFYWHIAKAFYRPDFTLGDMNHINFDWYAPKYAHRQTPEEVKQWCEELSLKIEHMHVENAGITVVARR